MSKTGRNWWDPSLDDSQRFAAVFTALSSLKSMQASRVQRGRSYEATYEQQNLFAFDSTAGMAGLPGPSGWNASGLGEDGAALLTFNAMQIGFDTLCSKLEQANGQVVFQTDGGDWEQQQKALQLKKLVSGEFYRLKFYELKAMVALDMLLHGTGYIKFYCDPITHKPSMMRWHPSDVWFDEIESRDLPPLTMYTTQLSSKQVLKSIWPKMADEIDAATTYNDSAVSTTRGLNPEDAVELIEAWRLPSAPGAGDGMHIISLSTCTLECDEWTRLDFPFARQDWCKKRRGPYSIPAAEQVIMQQRELNRLIQRQHECLYMLSAPYIIYDEASGFDPANMESSGVGNFIPVTQTGLPPTIVTNKVVPDDIRITIQELSQNIYALLGINGLESTGQKPAGLDTAPAMASYMDQSSLRHIKTLKENERFTLRCAEQLLLLMRDIKEEYGEYAAFGEGTKEVEKIKFSEADLPPDAYVMKMAMMSTLPDTPAGRRAAISEMAATGAFTPKQIIQMYRSPDTEAFANDVTATEQDIDWTIWELSRPDRPYIPPEASQDLQLGVTKVNGAYLTAKRQKAPPEVLEKLSMWKTAATRMLQAQEQAAIEQQMQQQQQMLQMQSQAEAGTAQAKAQADAQGKIAQKQGEAEVDMHVEAAKKEIKEREKAEKAELGAPQQ